MVQRDYLLRLIEQFIEAIARILGLARDGNFSDAKREIDAAYRSLGIARSMADQLDDSSLRMLLGEDKLRVLAMLFVAEAHVLRAQHRDSEAAALEARVRNLGFDPGTVLERRPPER